MHRAAPIGAALLLASLTFAGTEDAKKLGVGNMDPIHETYLPVTPEKPFSEVMKADVRAKPDVRKRQQAVLERRYDLSDRPSKVMMSGRRRAVQEGVRVKLPKGASWEKLASMTPDEVRTAKLFPPGYSIAPSAIRWYGRNDMRIAQLSDIHISVDGSHPRGIDVRTNFQRVLAEVCRGTYDLLVLSGDLAATRRHGAAYAWIARELRQLPIPVLVMAGNHDDRARMIVEFGLEHELIEGNLNAKRRFSDATVYGLDTSTSMLSEGQVAWLEQSIASDPQRALVFMHHPPVDCGHGFMDRYQPLLNRGEIWRPLSAIRGVDVLFCGHYHTHEVVEKDGVRVVFCPSTELQISRESEAFQIEHQRPGYLEIIATPEDVTWHVHYLDAGSRLPA